TSPPERHRLMRSRRNPRADELGRLLAHEIESAGTGGGTPCPDANLLAGMLRGGLEPGERQAVDEHLVGCGGCRSIPAAVARGNDPAIDTAWRMTRSRWLRAAALLVGVITLGIAGAALLQRGANRPRNASLQDRLMASADHLRTARPDLFHDFYPL